MIHYSTCPVCSSHRIKQVLEAIDQTVSGEQFSIWECDHCGLRFTQDVPGQDEIGPYYQSGAYVSHSDTREGLVNRLYHRVRKITLAGKKHLVQKVTGKVTGSLLDIGCGTGAFLHTMREAGWEVTGLEPDPSARQKAVELYQVQPKPSPEIFSLPPQSFDAITAWHVLEHVHELHAYMERIKELLKKEGKAFVAVPNYTSGDADQYQAGWAAYDVPRHLYHFSPKAWMF